MNTEWTDIDLWQSERTMDFEKRNGFQQHQPKLPLSCVISIMLCITVLFLLTRPDGWSWGTRLNRGSKSLCVHGMHELEGVVLFRTRGDP